MWVVLIPFARLRSCVASRRWRWRPMHRPFCEKRLWPMLMLKEPQSLAAACLGPNRSESEQWRASAWTVWICMNGYEWIYDWFINMIWPYYNMVRSLTGLINLRLDVSNPSHFCVPTMIIPGTMFQNGPKWLICSVMSRRSAPQRRSLQRTPPQHPGRVC